MPRPPPRSLSAAAAGGRRRRRGEVPSAPHGKLKMIDVALAERLPGLPGFTVTAGGLGGGEPVVPHACSSNSAVLGSARVPHPHVAKGFSGVILLPAFTSGAGIATAAAPPRSPARAHKILRGAGTGGGCAELRRAQLRGHLVWQQPSARHGSFRSRQETCWRLRQETGNIGTRAESQRSGRVKIGKEILIFFHALFGPSFRLFAAPSLCSNKEGICSADV